MVAEMASERALIGEFERAGSEPVRHVPQAPARRVAEPAQQGTRQSRSAGAGPAGRRCAGRLSGGLYQALHEAGIEPDWVIGTSIGAINASLIAGSDPDDRLDRLEEFWGRVEHGPLHRLLGAMPDWADGRAT